MKRLYFLLLITAFLGCKKSTTSSPSITTIQYDFTASASSNYLITYTDATGANVQVNYTGMAWSSPILTVSSATGFKTVTLSVTGTSSTSITCNADIKVGGVATNVPTFYISPNSGGINFTMVVFN